MADDRNLNCSLDNAIAVNHSLMSNPDNAIAVADNGIAASEASTESAV